MLEELRGMREEVKIGRQASRIESAELSQRVDKLEQEIGRIKEKISLK